MGSAGWLVGSRPQAALRKQQSARLRVWRARPDGGGQTRARNRQVHGATPPPSLPHHGLSWIVTRAAKSPGVHSCPPATCFSTYSQSMLTRRNANSRHSSNRSRRCLPSLLAKPRTCLTAPSEAHHLGPCSLRALPPAALPDARPQPPWLPPGPRALPAEPLLRGWHGLPLCLGHSFSDSHGPCPFLQVSAHRPPRPPCHARAPVPARRISPHAASRAARWLLPRRLSPSAAEARGVAAFAASSPPVSGRCSENTCGMRDCHQQRFYVYS